MHGICFSFLYFVMHYVNSKQLMQYVNEGLYFFLIKYNQNIEFQLKKLCLVINIW